MTPPADPAPVLLRPTEDTAPGDLAELRPWLTPRSDGDIEAHLALAARLGASAPLPGHGRTIVLWEILASLGSVGLQRARTLEPHLDARAILSEAGSDIPDEATWGVFAAEGPGVRLEATRTDAGWRLDGVKPWCSLGGRLSHALVTAWVDAEQRGLFAVDLSDPGVRSSGDEWVARGLRDIPSTALSLDGVAATPVGGPGWYLRRDGFAYGGIGVAAVWYGAAVALGRRLTRPSGREPDQIALLHVGRADLALTSARAVLREAAAAVDAGAATGPAGALLAQRVRGVVAGAAEQLLETCAHALGPQPLVAEPDVAALVADLGLYLRQHHAERDLAALGHQVLDGDVWS